MSDIKTVAVVGAGIGRNHIEGGYLRNADKFRVMGLCDISEERLATVGGELGIPLLTTRFEDLLENDEIDIVDICTPPMVHYGQVIAALRAGKHVVCEKPLVGSLKQIDEVMAVERESRGRLMPVFQYRFGNGIGQAKAIIDAGLAGKPYVGTVETLWRREAPYYAVPWRGKWATELGGVLMGHAIHTHDIFLYLMGPATGLFGRVATRVNDIEVEDCVSASVQMASGALGSFTASLGSADEISRIRLAFENVTFESDHAPYSPGALPWKILPRSPETAAAIDELLKDWTPQPSRFEGQFALFHEALVTGGPLPVKTSDSRAALELVTAFYHSSRTRTEAILPIGADHPNYASWLPEDAGP